VVGYVASNLDPARPFGLRYCRLQLELSCSKLAPRNLLAIDHDPDGRACAQSIETGYLARDADSSDLFLRTESNSSNFGR
jgi:hypothetical protein